MENYPAASAIGSGSSNIANLGEIVVNVYSIKTKGYARRSKGKYDDLHDHAEVAEKDLKGKSVTHGAKYD